MQGRRGSLSCLSLQGQTPCGHLQQSAVFYFCPLFSIPSFFSPSPRPQILRGMTTWPLEHNGHDPVFLFLSLCLSLFLSRRSFSSLGRPDRTHSIPNSSQFFPVSSAGQGKVARNKRRSTPAPSDYSELSTDPTAMILHLVCSFSFFLSGLKWCSFVLFRCWHLLSIFQRSFPVLKLRG